MKAGKEGKKKKQNQTLLTHSFFGFAEDVTHDQK